jgi:indolepyruvate ferredoxin oxidoreductase, beta subunit
MSKHMSSAVKPITILVTALGGEGGGVLAEWLVETAVRSGHSAQSTSIPGVAQRTGATTYYVEVFPLADAELGGKKPVFSLNPVAGAIDLLASSELLETARQIGAGMTTRERSHVVSSTSRSLTTAEKMPLGDGRTANADLLALVREHSREAQVFDMAKLARETGTVISAVLFGAIAASGVLPLPRAACEETIRESDKGVAASLRGFAAAFDIVATMRMERRAVDDAVAAASADVAARASEARAERASDASDTTLDAALAALPADVRELVVLGHARLVDYQDRRYAELYLERLGRVRAAEQAGDPDDANGHAATRAAARWLALWMAFDDVVRVADLKTRATRFARVAREVKVEPGDVLQVVDHFKPGVAELAGLLPRRFAAALVRWDRRRVARGREAFALPLKIRTDTVFGFLLLRGLAATRALRRHGSRFAAEQAAIERWLDGIVAAARGHAGLGAEIAECGRLIKGYGATNERGKENLLHVVDHLAVASRFASDGERAAAIRAARNAALADESGLALDQALLSHGAPARPVKEQPIRWVRSRPGRPVEAAPRSSEPAP